MAGADKRQENLAYAAAMVRRVCSLAGSPTLINDARAELSRRRILKGVRQHDDAVLFTWLLDNLNFQGVSDAIAAGYLERHGNTSWDQVAQGLDRAGCPKLANYWTFNGCGYRKTMRTCNEPRKYRGCPLPRHDMRNGRLNQSAYALHLFFRDVAHGDFVGWLDARLEDADEHPLPDRSARLAEAVVEPLTRVYGVSFKLLNMTLSQLLLAADPRRERWRAAGAAMIAVDSLVHAWLGRTGILRRLDSDHAYGPACYRANGCAELLRIISRRIDATRFNPAYPKAFPRFVQHAVWQFCAQGGLNQCNGNRIKAASRCNLSDCPLFDRCDRVPQRPGAEQTLRKAA